MSRCFAISLAFILASTLKACGHPAQSELQPKKVGKQTSYPQYGFISLRSPFDGRYLQAHSDNGETHASNDTRHNEETWLLAQVDRHKHLFALRNASNGLYLSAEESGCVRANKPDLGVWEQWFFEKVVPHNNSDKRSYLRSARTDYRGYLGTNPPGNNYDPCGGEVHYVAQADTGWLVTAEPDWGGSGSSIDFGTILSMGPTCSTYSQAPKGTYRV